MMSKLNLLDKIPWRFRSKTNFLNEHSNFIFRKILKTRPLPCKPTSDVNYISLVCHRDVNICLLAVKSFLRFYDNVRVTLQDDGSLTPGDITKFEHHIPGVAVLSRSDADKKIERLLNQELFDMRSHDVSFLKLLDVNLLFDGRKIVADSDILFLRRPTEIIDWIETKNAPPFYHQVLNANKAFEAQLQRINHRLGTTLTELDYCSGFIGFNDSFSVEEMTRVARVLNNISKVWGLEQNIYALLLKERSSMLNPSRYTAIIEKTAPALVENACMIHFVGKLKHKQYVKHGIEIIANLI
ncbi:MAG: hypothetical protein JXA04_04710 [Gammaproteobacteria bacterium]|nr:hypothetical protein [Gammaproteobacteria bacterium]